MEVPATVTSKGQVTIPARVRKALGLSAGDRIIFRVADGTVVLRPEGHPCVEAEMKRVPDFFALAGSVPTPPGATTYTSEASTK